MQDIRNEVYKLLGEYSVVTASIDTNITNRIDGLINRYYFELAEKDKVSALTKISQFPIENMLGEIYDYQTYTTTAIPYTQASARTYFFEVDNECAVDIKEGSNTSTMTTLSTLDITGISTFTKYRGLISAATASNYITMSFYGTAPFTIRNVAMYAYTFGNNTASIPDFMPYLEYALSSDYMKTKNVSYRLSQNYGVFTDYIIENGYLMIPRGYSAEFYHNYWKQVSGVATATNTFDVRDKTAAIIPFGVAADILIGNGFNVAAGRVLEEKYERMKAQIDTFTDQGRKTISNYKGW